MLQTLLNMAFSNSPPPSYREETYRKPRSLRSKSRSSSGSGFNYGAANSIAPLQQQQHSRPSLPSPWPHPGSGPAWLYHKPHQSQFNTPFASLHYHEISGFKKETLQRSFFPERNSLSLGQTLSLDLLAENPEQVICPRCGQVG